MTAPATVRPLAEEHGMLLREVDRRVGRALDSLAAGRWPVGQVERLVDFLRYEVLDQVAEEERLLYPLIDGGFADPRLRELVAEHVHLRDLIDQLAMSTTARDRLAGVLTELSAALRDHLDHEQRALSPVTPVGIEALRHPFRSHEWFVVTEGPVLDLAELPREQCEAAALDRLLRMRPGDRVEVRSTRSLEPLVGQLRQHDLMTDYGWVYLEEGPGAWRAEITRRR